MKQRSDHKLASCCTDDDILLSSDQWHACMCLSRLQCSTRIYACMPPIAFICPLILVRQIKPAQH